MDDHQCYNVQARDANTPKKRAIRVLDSLIRDLEKKLEELEFIRRVITNPSYDDRWMKDEPKM